MAIGLILILLFIIVAIVWLKIHPFLVLIFSAVVMGFLSGMDGGTIIEAVTAGFGKTAGSIGIVIALGAAIGVFLEKSGATTVLAERVLAVTGNQRPALAMNLTGFIVSIPVFCDSGYMILSPLARALGKKSRVPVLFIAVALATGLYAAHVFIPPTPGPLAAAALLNADIGQVMLLGFLVALPVSLSGYWWGITRKTDYREDKVLPEEKSDHPGELPGGINAIMPVLLPILLIALKSVADLPAQPLGSGRLQHFLLFTGHPAIALFLGFVFAFVVLGNGRENRSAWVGEALTSAAVLILITGAGGAFGYVLQTGGFGERAGEYLSNFRLGIFLPFLMAAIIKSAQGSSTVAIITTAAIVAPLLGVLGLDAPTGRTLAVLATGAGAMTVSHLNDSYFWVVSRFSGLEVPDTLKSFTLATFIQGVSAIFIIWLLQLIMI